MVHKVLHPIVLEGNDPLGTGTLLAKLERIFLLNTVLEEFPQRPAFSKADLRFLSGTG